MKHLVNVVLIGLIVYLAARDCRGPVDPVPTTKKAIYVYESSKIGLPAPDISAALRYLSNNGIEARSVDKDNVDGLNDESDDIKEGVSATTETPALVLLPGGTVTQDATAEQIRAVFDG